MEVWRYGGMDAWMYGGMEAWRYGGMEVWTYGGMEVSCDEHQKSGAIVIGTRCYDG